MSCWSNLLLLLWLGAPSAESSQVVHHQQSDFSHIYVVDEGDLRYLRFGGPDADDQSVISRRNPDSLPMDYLRLAALGLAVPDKPQRVLMIGLGAGAFTTWLYRKFPKLQIDVVEIDPAVVDIARRFFGLPQDPRYRVHVADGARFIRKGKKRFDLIFVDAYDAQDMPQALITPGFFERIRFRLQADGVAVLNLSLAEPAEKAIAGVFSRAFPVVRCLRTIDGDNLLLFGYAKYGGLSSAQFRGRAKKRLGPLGRAAGRLGSDCPRAP